MKSHKLEDCKENVIDFYFLRLVEDIGPLFHRAGLTPNAVTTISLVPGLLAIYFLYKEMPILFVVSLALYYFLDCLDGYLARTYHLCSRFGDLYDHARDVFIQVAIFLILTSKLHARKRYDVIALLVVHAVLMIVHLGCQENNSQADTNQEDHACYSETIQAVNLCFDDQWIEWTRLFGCGSYNLFVALIALILL